MRISDWSSDVCSSDLVKRTGKSLQIGTQRRHSNDYKLLADTIRNDSVGDILYSDLNDYRGDWRVPEEDEYPEGVSYWRLSQRESGGAVFEMGAHIIDEIGSASCREGGCQKG